jgi:uncharacterized protein YunC (DUF1805 family)
MEANIETITVNGKTYYSQKPQEPSGDLRIVILQRGWTMVGRFERKGSECKLHNASVVRMWGTTKGLGEIAANGPTSNTKLDPCNGLVEFDYLTVVATICCNGEKWKL